MVNLPTDLDESNVWGVHTSLEPPGIDDDDPDDGPPEVLIYVTLWEPDGTRKTANVAIPADTPDDQIAALFVQVMVGVAAMRGPRLLDAVKDRLREAPNHAG